MQKNVINHKNVLPFLLRLGLIVVDNVIFTITIDADVHHLDRHIAVAIEIIDVVHRTIDTGIDVTRPEIVLQAKKIVHRNHRKPHQHQISMNTHHIIKPDTLMSVNLDFHQMFHHSVAMITFR